MEVVSGGGEWRSILSHSKPLHLELEVGFCRMCTVHVVQRQQKDVTLSLWYKSTGEHFALCTVAAIRPPPAIPAPPAS